MSCDSEAFADPSSAAPPQALSPMEAAASTDRFAGRYRFTGGEAQRDALLVAIDDVVADMNVLARGIARDRLREANPVPSELSIARDEHTCTIGLDDRKYTAPLDGSSTEVVGITGDTLQYSVTISGDRIDQTFVGPKGTRKNTLRLGADGALEMRVEIGSESLPKALRYRLSFQRSS
jgi:hypothetical protein